MTPSRIPRRTVLVTGALTLAAGCSDSSGTTGGDGEVAVTVAITSANAPLEAAVAEGVFARHGLAVETVELPNGTETIASTQGGSAQFAYADVFAGVSAIGNGFDLALVQAQNGTSLAAPVVVTADSPITDPAQLEGASIGLGVAPFNQVFASLFLEANGVDPASVEFVPFRSGQAEALTTDQVDALLYVGGGAGGSARFVQEKQAYDLREIGTDQDAPAAVGEGATQAAWFVGTDWAEANADTVERFVAAVREGNAWWDGLEDARKAELLLEFSDVDLVTLEQEVPGALAYAVDGNNVVSTGALDLEATYGWIELGRLHVPDSIPDVSREQFEEHVWPTALAT